jgi:hypothetical protein
VLFAPLIAEHPFGTVVKTELTGWLHRSQKMTKVGAGEPAHVPVLTVHVVPTVLEPETVGAIVFAGIAGGTDRTAVVLTAPASAKPEVFTPATWAVRYLSRSAAVDRYEVLFAPVIAEHPVGTAVKAEVTAWLHRSQ